VTQRILLIGGYGNFGKFIAKRLARESALTVIIAGRSADHARRLAAELNTEWAAFDINNNLDRSLREIAPDILIHTSGPFQGQSYDVAEACIRNRVHYIDLADGRDFVTNVGRLDPLAKAARVLVVSGASTVPGLTAAVLIRYAAEFAALERLDFGIATAQQTNRGLATVQAVLSYAGKPFTTLIDGRMQTVQGWQGLTWRRFTGLGLRSLANCDIPDLALFPKLFPTLRTIRFRAGLELAPLQLGLWLLTWLVRAHVIPNLRSAAPVLHHAAQLFDRFGTDDSGFYMELRGRSATGERQRLSFDLVARAGDGLMIPCTPAIVLALRLVHGDIVERGASPCIGLVDLDALLDELKSLRITWTVSRD
jgi:hypothetical protein